MIAGLNPETTYAFRAVAKNASTQKWLDNSNVVSVTTAPDAPVISTTETLDVNVIEITTEGAILRGKVTDNGGATVTQWGFAWREEGAVDWSTYRFEGTLAENVVEEYELTGLEADTEYEFFFYARNSVGESIHDNRVKTFRTAAEGNTAPSMAASLKVPAESVEANEDVYFIFNVENCDKVQFVADGQYGFVIDLLTDTNVKKLGEGKYEWKYAFNNPGENRRIQFVPYNGRTVGVVTEAIILNVTAHLNVSCDTTIEPSKWGGDGEIIHLDCNVEWTATTDSPSWITLNADVENNTLNHTYTRNSGYKTREGTITLSAPGCASIVIKVIQEPAPAELVFKAGMNGNSQLQLSIHSGALNPDDAYTMKIYDQSGKLMGAATRTLASGFSSKSWSIGNPSAGGGLQLPRAVTYTVKVFDFAGKAQKFIDSNGNKHDYQNVTVPLWNGDMIKWVKSGSTAVQNGGTLIWGQDISAHWDGSYGVENTLITMTVGQKTISITEKSDGELTTTFVANGGYMTEIPEEMQPTPGQSVDVTITVSVNQNGMSRSNTWKGKFVNSAAEPSEWYSPDLDDMRIFINGSEKYSGTIAPDAKMRIKGIEKPENIEVYIGEDVVEVEYKKEAEQDYVICLQDGYIWSPGNYLTVRYNGFDIAEYDVGYLYDERYAGKKIAGNSDIFLYYKFNVTAERNFIASVASSEKYRKVYSLTYDLVNGDYQPVKDAVAVDNAYDNKISICGLSKSGDVCAAIKYPANSKYPDLKTEFIQYPSKLEEVTSLTDAKGDILCEVEFYLEDKWFQVNDNDVQRVRYGITTGFEVIRELYGDVYTDKLYKTLREKNGNNPVKVFFVDTDVDFGGYSTSGANMGDFGIIYINADFWSNRTSGIGDEELFINGRNQLSATIAHELQHYYYSLIVGGSGFMNEVYSNYCDNLTARRLQSTSGKWAANYAEGHDVLEYILKSKNLQSDEEVEKIVKGLTPATAGTYELYTAFGYYLQYCSTTNKTLALDCGMSGLLSYLEEEATEGGDGKFADYRALFRGFNNGISPEGDAVAEEYFTKTIVPDFQNYMQECKEQGKMV